MTIAELFAKITIKPDKRSFDAAEKLMAGLKTALLAVVAVKTAEFFGNMVEDTVELGSHINDLSQSAGVDAESLQELGYAAVQNSSSMDGMADGLKKLSKNIFEATNGNKEMAKEFRRAGIAVKNADGTLRSADDVFMDLSDHIAAMPDGTKKTALAMTFLGRSGSDLIPTMNGGSEALAKYRQEAHDLGGVIDNDAIGKLDDLGDTQDKVKTALTGLRNEAVVALLPALKEMADKLLAWVKANREVIKQKLQTVIAFLAKAMMFFAKVVGVVIDIIAFLGKHLDLVVVGIMAIVGALAIFEYASIAAAIASGIAWAIANIPLLLMIAAIAAIILIVEDLYQAFTGGESVFKDMYEYVKEWLVEKTAGLMDTWVGTVVKGFMLYFTYVKTVLQTIYDQTMAIIHAVEYIVKKAQDIKGALGSLGGGAIDLFSGGSKDSGPQTNPFKMGFDPQAFQDQTNPSAPTINIPTSENAGGGNSFAAQITIDGSKDPQATATAVNDALYNFWHGQMRKATAQSGAKR